MSRDSESEGRKDPASDDMKFDRSFLGQKEQAEFQDVLRQLDAGQISAERAQARIMELFHYGMGAGLRAMGESRPALATALIQRLTKALGHVSQDLPTGRQAVGEPAEQKTVEVSVKNKKIDVLLREEIILGAMTATNAQFTFAEIRQLVVDAGVTVNDPTLITNLDRLVKDDVIERPRKGMYGGLSESRAYLERIRFEIASRNRD